MDLTDATVDDASFGEKDAAVAGDVGGEGGSEAGTGSGCFGGDGFLQSCLQRGADRQFVGADGNAGNDTAVDVVGDVQCCVNGAYGRDFSGCNGRAVMVENWSRG